MTRRWRTSRYGAAIALAVVGVACGATISGTLGGTLATALLGVGLVGMVSLVFYEIGLSEDRDRARAPAAQPDGPAEPPAGAPQGRPTSPQSASTRSAGGQGARSRRLGRDRGKRRRLR